MTGAKSILKKTGKVFLWILGSLLILVIAVLIFINTKPGKRVVRNQVVKYLEGKFKTRVEIGAIDYSLPKWLKIQNVYFEDQKKDTLLYGGELAVDLDMIKLIRGNTDIKKILFKNIYINIQRAEKDSFFNYQYIVDAFSGNKSTTPNKDTAEMKLTLDRLLFENVALNFTDKFGGNDFKAQIKNLELTTNKFQPDRMNFGINELYANGVKFFMNTYKETPVAGGENPPVDSVAVSPYALFISAKNVSLRDVDVLVDNKISGLYYANKITQLGGSNILFSAGNYQGTADLLRLDSSGIIFSAPKPVIDSIKIDSAVAAPLPWLFAVRQFAISNTSIRYDDNSKPRAGGLDFAHLNAKDLNAAVSGFKFSKDTTSALISQFAFRDTSGFQLDTTHVNFIFTDTLLSATELYVKTPRSVIQRSLELRYDSIPAITKAPQNSLINAALTNTTIAFNDIYLLAPALEKSLPRAQFANQYLNLNTELRGNLSRLYIPYLQISGLSGSRISGSGTVYNVTDPNRFSFDLYFDRINLFKKDLLKFVPPANQKQFASLPDVINFKGKLVGDKNNVAADVNVSAKDLSFIGRINLKNISDPAKLAYDVNVTRASVTKNLIAGFMPPAALEQINLPQQISVSGKLTGNTENVVADLRAASSYGPITIKGYVKNIKDPQRANYDLVMSTPGFALGTLLKQDTILGTIAGTFTAKGTGFDYKTMRSNIDARIASLQFNKYTYLNANLTAALNNGIIKSSGNVNDEALRLSYDLDANVKGEYPVINALVDVDTVQLKKLNLYKDTLNFSLLAKIQSSNLKPRNLNASLILDSIRMQSGRNFYRIDSAALLASSANGIDSIVFTAPFAEVHAGGAFDYDKIGISIQDYVNNYYHMPGYKPSTQKIPDQQFAIRGVIRSSPIVTGLVPDLQSYEDINFSGSYSTVDTDSALNFRATIPRLTYATNRLSHGAINVGSRDGRINYLASFDTLKTATNTIYPTSVNGAAARDSISLNARTKDNTNRNWFGIAGSAFVNGDTYSFRLQDTLLLNYERWNVAPDNYISYSPKGIIVNNFLIRSDTASISLKSRELVVNSPIDIDINNFNLKSITSIVNKDTTLVAGVLDMKASVTDLDKPLPGFTGNASVEGLSFMNHLLGNLTANASKVSDNNVSADIALKGPGNDLDVKGNYYLNNTEKEFDADLQLRQLSFRTLEALSNGQLQNSSGNISGNLALTGKFADPRWNGQFSFDTVKFSSAQLGTPYLIDKQKIVFNYPTISFPNFMVTDSVGHPLKINGSITSRTMMDYDLNIGIKASDFAVINAKRAVNSQAYGYASVDMDVAINGTSASPNIEGDIKLNDKSDVHIVLPEASYAKKDTKEIVRFIDRDTFQINPPVTPFQPEGEPVKAFAQFLNYNLNIELTKAAALTILVDPVTGDEIKLQGDARLNAGVDPGGNLLLAGTYELDNGYYDLHYQILERKFNLIKGSTITFAGDPLDATANITAEYIANTSSKTLLSNEVTDVSPTLANSFNQQLPFRVILYLTGPLKKPNINFDIQLPEQNNLLNNDLRTTIENKLQQIRTDPASINKQVFSLLLLGRFTGEQSSDFFKGNGGDFSDLARQSVSQFLSSALNEIAGDLFKGIDIDLNLNSYNDFSNGGNTERTDLNIAVSKSFANDRITVSVGQTFGVQGADAASKAGASSSGFKPDVSVAYKLTADGKYLIRAYTRNQLDVTLDGYVVETGVAFLVTMDYDKFSELFRRKKKK